MNSVFSIRGRVINESGYPIQNLRLAIVDKDVFFDDLIGVGFTNSEGKFQMDFTEKEFNQDFLEHESYPDIYIVFSLYHPEQKEFVAIGKQEFFHLRFSNRQEDLGDILIQTQSGHLKYIPDQDVTPGYKKRVQRLDLNDDLINHCLSEVCPMVESLTGWKGLLIGLKFEMIDSITQILDKIVKIPIETFNGIPQKIFLKFVSRGMLALYEPHWHTIFIFKGKVSGNNLDALKVTLGHELVHVGQFKYHPELILEQERAMNIFQGMLQKDIVEEQAIIKLFQNSSYIAFMEKIEGYAYYIQKDFLEKYYNCATFFEQGSMFEILLVSLIKKFDSENELNQIIQSKNDQYTKGRDFFLGKQRDRVVPFMDP
ncbi:MAG: hypothetical protein KDK54_21380 [Leptospiraceae bacterium]|nr:hypothetical protein [Leptospiraceae bacterium]